ncbi:MAG TPA: helix-turn-helix transcriptional regulator [Firmicutes bacterium]|nr:helix-turn-helix transcriptional regulator [Bacillota bacterium]
MTTPSELKKLTKQKKMTYQKLSEISGVPLGTIKNIFSGLTPTPRLDTIQKIERALGIGWTEEEYAAGIVPTVVRNVTPEEDDLLQAFRDLGAKKGEHAQALALKMIEEMVNL